MKSTSLFCNFLDALGVPHTVSYSENAFGRMPFQTLFGLKKLLLSYGVDSDGYAFDDPERLRQLATPFIAQTRAGFVVITSIEGDRVGYVSRGARFTTTFATLAESFRGTAFLAFPRPGAREPDYGSHLRSLWMVRLKTAAMWTLLVALAAWFVFSQPEFVSWSLFVLIALTCAGLFFSLLLMKKSLRLRSRSADKVCGVIEKGGCDTVLDTGASTFFGIFSWAEVGTSYFLVTLFTLIVWPEYIPCLAALNLCCLPFSFWSVWYQKFRAKAWCTMCLSVQAILWLSAAAYLFTGWWHASLFPFPGFWILAVAYAATLLVINHIDTVIKQK